MKIAVYLAAVPAKTKNQAKRDLLLRFGQGAKACGEEVWLVEEHTVIDADIAVLQGWVGMKSAPHLELRRKVIKEQRKKNKHTLVIDSNLYGFLDTADKDRYLRYSLDGIFPTTGFYFDNRIDPARWAEIKNSYGFQERPWHSQGQYVLICLQRDGGWSMDGFSILQWLDTIIPRIRAITNRQILIRPHPGSLRTVPDVRKQWPDIAVSDNDDIRQDLDRAWCTVTYNSSPGVASLLWGVPSFITDPDPRRSQVNGWACTDLSMIENPPLLDRSEFYHKLAQCHFATDTLATGDAWRFMRARLP